jgi:hypothetical protein
VSKHPRLKRGLLVGCGILVGIRLLAPFIAAPTSRGVYRLLSRTGLDDELSAASIPISEFLFWPLDRGSVLGILEEIVGEHQANDLRVFSAARSVARRLTPDDAAAVFLDHARRLQAAPCDRKFIVAPLLPLAERGGLLGEETSSRSIWDAYQRVGYRGQGDKNPCRLFQNVLNACMASERPIKLPPASPEARQPGISPQGFVSGPSPGSRGRQKRSSMPLTPPLPLPT